MRITYSWEVPEPGVRRPVSFIEDATPASFQPAVTGVLSAAQSLNEVDKPERRVDHGIFQLNHGGTARQGKEGKGTTEKECEEKKKKSQLICHLLCFAAVPLYFRRATH